MIRRPPRSPLFPYTTALPISRGPLCVGIDPHAPLLERWGLPDSPDGLARFTDTVVDALAGSVAVLKPQLAFYERHGSRGLAVLEDAVRSEEHTSELQSRQYLVCRLLLEKKKNCTVEVRVVA